MFQQACMLETREKFRQAMGPSMRWRLIVSTMQDISVFKGKSRRFTLRHQSHPFPMPI